MPVTPTQDEINTFASAAKTGDIKTVTDYLDRFGAAIINERDNFQDTALTWAAWTGQKVIIELLLDRGAEINKPGMTDRTAIGWAANGGRQEIVALLMDRGADATLRDRDGSSPADLARHTGRPDLADFITENGAQKRKEAAEKAAVKKAEEDGRTLTEQRLQNLKKNKPPKLKF